MKQRIRYTIKFVLFAFVILSLPQTAWSSLIELSAQTSSVPIGKMVSYYEDASGELTLEDIRTEDFQKQFIPSRVEQLNFGFSKSAYWVKIEYTYQSEAQQLGPKTFLLEHAFPLVDYVDFYHLEPDGSYRLSQTGDQRAFSEREIKYSHFVFTFNAQPNAPGEIYIRMRTDTGMQAPLEIWDPIAFLEYVNHKEMIMGLLYGSMGIMVLYNFFLLLSVRDLSYLYYILYIASFLMAQMAIRGHGFEYLWPESTWIGNRAVSIWAPLSYIFIVLFTRQFLNTRLKHPVIDKICLFSLLVTATLFCSAFILHYDVTTRLTTLNALLTSALIIIISIISWAKGNRQARFFLMAWVAFFAGIIVLTLMTFGYLPTNAFTKYSFHIGAMVEAIMLSIALADSINIERFHRDHAQADALEAQNQALQNLKKYQSVFENAVEGLFQFSFDGRLINANPSFCHQLGYSNKSEVMQNVSDWRDDVFVERSVADIVLRELKVQSKLVEYEVQYRDKAGVPHWGALSGRVVKDDEGQPSLFEGSLVDITERRERELADRRREAAEASAKAKSTFLANMSHEIRTPMNAIIGFSELAIKSNADPRQANYLNKIHASSHTLLGIINDILDFSKIEAGKLNLEKIEFNLDDVVGEVGDLFANKIEEKDIEVCFAVSHSVPRQLVGDPLRLKQVMINLISNAIKFTEQGEVDIRVNVVEKTDSGCVLKFIVRDTGIGISQQNIQKLFDSFTQADDSTSRRFGGTGLGLTICKRLVELMGGRILVKSDVGAGSEFAFTACFQIGDVANAKDDAQALWGKTVLVVDDHPTAREVLTLMLEPYCTVVTVADSTACWEELKKRSVDVIVVDYKLGDEDGVSLVKQVRASNYRELPIVAITVIDREDVHNEMRKQHVSHFISKPVKESQLVHGLLQALSVEPSSDASADTNEYVKDFGGQRVLLVEDNPINQELASELLSSVNLDVVVAENGSKALSVAQSGPFDLILMDIQMPEMNGHDATKEIRLLRQHASTPIIAMTANAMKGEREKCIASGMNDYITKPIDAEYLFEKIAEYLPGKDVQVNSPSQPSAAIATNDQVVTQSTSNIGDQRGMSMDVDAAIAAMGGNRKLFERLILDFTSKYANAVENVNRLVGVDPEDAARYVHTLKGLAGTFGAESLRQIAFAVETAIKKENRAVMQALLDDLQRELEPVVEFARSLSPQEELVNTEATDTSDVSVESALATLIEKLERNDYASKQHLVTLKASGVFEETALVEIEGLIEGFSFAAALEKAKLLNRLL